jgi:hypothetical protein
MSSLCRFGMWVRTTIHKRVSIPRLLACGLVLCGLLSAPAIAMASDEGFSFTNDSAVTLKLAAAKDHDGSPLADCTQVPPIGTTLAPSQKVNFNVTYKPAHLTGCYLTFNAYDWAGNPRGSVQFWAEINGCGFAFSTPCVWVDQSSPNTSFHWDWITHPAGGGWALYHDGGITDLPNTVLNFSAQDAQVQANYLNDVCTADPSPPYVNCQALTLTSSTPIESANHIVGTPQHNTENTPITPQLYLSDTTTTTTSVGNTVSADANFFDVFKAGYSRMWGTSLSNAITVSQYVPVVIDPGYEGWVCRQSPEVRVTGNYKIVLGNTTLNLNGVYLDSPDPNPDDTGVLTNVEAPWSPGFQPTCDSSPGPTSSVTGLSIKYHPVASQARGSRAASGLVVSYGARQRASTVLTIQRAALRIGHHVLWLPVRGDRVQIAVQRISHLRAGRRTCPAGTVVKRIFCFLRQVKWRGQASHPDRVGKNSLTIHRHLAPGRYRLRAITIPDGQDRPSPPVYSKVVTITN